MLDIYQIYWKIICHWQIVTFPDRLSFSESFRLEHTDFEERLSRLSNSFEIQTKNLDNDDRLNNEILTSKLQNIQFEPENLFSNSNSAKFSVKFNFIMLIGHCSKFSQI